MKFAILLLSTFSLAIISCTKDSSEDNEDTNNTTLLTQQIWRYDNVGADLDKNGTIDTNLPGGALQSCITDNTLSFATNGTGTVDEGATKCSTSAPQSTSITWSFANNETALNLNGPAIVGVGGQFKILALTSTQLSLSKDTTTNFGNISLILNLKH